MEPEMEEELARSGIPVAVQTLKDFLVKIAGPAAEEFGLLIRDKVRTWRFKKQLDMLGNAQRMLKEAGIEPSSVPWKTLVPLLEGAALEQDDDLSTKWAALLANAANPDCSVAVHPGFGNVLSQLSPIGARFLEEVAKTQEAHLKEAPLPRSVERIHVKAAPLIKRFGIALQDFDVMAENLGRLGLCEIGGPTFKEHTAKGEAVYERTDEVWITRFGFRFVMACRFPARESAPGD